MIFADPSYDSNRNTARPANGLGVAWDACAQVGGMTMAAVSHRHLVSAAHVGVPSTVATFPDGTVRNIVASVAHPSLDVMLHTLDVPVNRRVPAAVALPSVGQAVAAIGSGVTRGAAVMDGSTLTGWAWGSDGRRRWGINLLSSVAANSIASIFTATTGDDEMQATTGDSGGPLLCLESGEYRLLGVLYGVSRSGQALFGDTTHSIPLSAVSAWLSPLIANDLTNPFMSMTDYLENALLNHILRGVALPTLPANLYVALFTADPGEAGAFTNEVSGGSYARVAISRATGSWKDPATATQGQCKNTVAITFPTASAGWGTVSHVAIVDAASGGNILFKGALSVSTAIASGNTPSFDTTANQLTVTFD